ncbi:hypothetical protein QUB56_32110 [Microcoleus sp. AR_TQ3_B6]|uniref:hypothetical protein n=1 Tax=Microcoleus sp. AR_TQ3_B6 TaxID=3055284 RepID=UPI002FD4B4AD
MALHRLRSLRTVLQNRFRITELGTGNRELGTGNRQPSIGNRQSGIGNREPAIGNRQSGIGNRESAIGNRQSGTGNWELVSCRAFLKHLSPRLSMNLEPSPPRTSAHLPFVTAASGLKQEYLL